MCGIFGSVGPALAPDVLAHAVGFLGHRGPQGQGMQIFAGATLAHTRLRINDLSEAAAQPMANEDGTVWVTFNGEIYNFRELRTELEAFGHAFRSRSDSEVLVHGYEQWGDGLVSRLDGMFAFGVWDVQRARLLLARDRAGKKPLFYAEHNGSWFFASEMKALFAAGVPAVVSDAALVGFLAYGHGHAPQTPYEAVHELPAAHQMVLRCGEAPQVRSYWQVNFQATRPPPSESEAAEQVRQRLTEAVKKRLVADVPVGAFLSGGLDSTIVVGLMATLGERVRTFAIASPDAAYNEAPYARLVAQHFGTQHTEFAVTAADIPLIEKLTWHYDAPVGDSSAVPTYVVSRLTRQHVTVALTGDGGDELFAGYLRVGAAVAAEAIPVVLRPWLGRLAAHIPSSAASRGLRARSKRFLQAAARPLGDRITAWTSPFAFDLDQLLLPDLHPLGQQALVHNEGHFPRGSRLTPLAQVLNHNFRSYLPDDLLLKVDRATMAHALEARSPFLDSALIDYVSKLPDRYKRRGRTSKYILRRAFQDLVPAAIMNRPKMGFGLPLGSWFRGSLRAYLCDHIATSTGGLRRYVNGSYLDKLIATHMKGQSDLSQQLWTLLALEVWLRAVPQLGRSLPPDLMASTPS